MTLRGVARRMLGALGLAGLAREGRARWLSRAWRETNGPLRRAGSPDGLAIPPDLLVYLVAGTADVGWFLEGGRRAADAIRSALMEAGLDLDGVASLLDFGCGCGRVVRYWAGVSAAIHGCDLNEHLVRWCRENLPFGTFAVNRLEPPLPYGDGTFSLAYALSVFTHLDEPRQRAWMDEMYRVIRPRGHLVLSTHGRRYRDQLGTEELSAFDRGRLVVLGREVAGSNLCGAYHPETYVRQVLAVGFEVVVFRPEGALGNPHQDLWVLRKA
jgi:SAM-dependent methyltransferase